MVIKETNGKYIHGFFLPLNQAAKPPEHGIKSESKQSFKHLHD